MTPPIAVPLLALSISALGQQLLMHFKPGELLLSAKNSRSERCSDIRNHVYAWEMQAVEHIEIDLSQSFKAECSVERLSVER